MTTDDSTDAGGGADAGLPPPPVEPPPAPAPGADPAPEVAADLDTAPDPADEPLGDAPGDATSGLAPEPAEGDAEPAGPAAGDVPAAEAPSPKPEGSPEPAGPEPADEDERPWWSKPADAARDAWAEHAPEAQAAWHEIGAQLGQAAEIGAQIGDAIADRLDPNIPAQKRGLDIRWLHLGLNIPAVSMAVAAWVWGVGPAAALVRTIRVEGALAPLGWVLLVAGVLAVLALVPIGSALAGAVAHLVMALAGLVRSALARGWRLPYIGYLLRLVLVTLAWVGVLGIARFAWRLTLTWLTGV
ncbi:hypothetical protein EST92_28510 [Streptomyces sp. TM32]|uniref:hypothetical protein n=1 Tax=Streptomyces sp. TM32 TaxID=1652669 RepID=UPI001011B210|nr:hypothetical protein [Streptomyces sp. TM32]RXS66699.1 hypothetical protein EST92_28510 [Streptomyces sp. TM32]